LLVVLPDAAGVTVAEVLRGYCAILGCDSPARGCTPRGLGATGRYSGVLHEGPGLVQYAQPLASTPPPSCSSRPEGGPGRTRPTDRAPPGWFPPRSPVGQNLATKQRSGERCRRGK